MTMHYSSTFGFPQVVTLTLSAMGMFMFTTSTIADHAVHTERVEIPAIRAEGYDQPEARDIALVNPVPLEGVTSVIFDGFLISIERDGMTGKDDVHVRILLLAAGRVIASLEGPVFFWSGTVGGTILRFGREVTPEIGAAVDAVHVSVWTAQVEPGGVTANAEIRGLHRESRLRLHFIKGPLGPDGGTGHQRRFAGGIPPQWLPGEGTTEWQPFTLNMRVRVAHLRFMFMNDFGWSGHLAATSEMVLELRDGTLLPTVDDAFSPSEGQPRDGYNSASHCLLLDTETRIHFRDREIVGGRWRIHKRGDGAITVTPPDPAWFFFFYDDTDCNQNGVADIDEIAEDPSRDADGDGVLDTCQSALFRRGDANADGARDIADAICVLSYLFGPAGNPCKEQVPRCLDAADANDRGAVDISDGVFILQNLFASGPAIPPPSDQCGPDPTDDVLDCQVFEASCN